MDYKKVIEDYSNGTIDPGEWVVIMDNDGGYWSYLGEGKTYDEEEKMRREMKEKYGSPDGYADLVELACAAGINSEWC